MAITTRTPNGPTDIMAELEGRAPEERNSSVAPMDFQNPELTQKLGALSVDPDLETPKPSENIFNAGPGSSDPKIQMDRAHGNHEGVRVMAGETGGARLARDEAKRHEQRYTRLITSTMMAVAISDQLDRAVSSVIGEQMKGINASHSKLNSLQDQVLSLEAQRADINLLYEELTPEQKMVEDQLGAAEKQQVQLEFLEMPSEFNQTLWDASLQIAGMEGIDPEVSEDARRGVFMSEVKDILAGNLEIEEASPYSVMIAQQVAENFEGTPAELASLAEQANVDGDFIEPTYDPVMPISPVMGGNNLETFGVYPQPFSGASVAEELGADSTIESIQADYAMTVDATGNFDVAAQGLTPAPANSPTDPNLQTPTVSSQVLPGTPEALMRQMEQGPGGMPYGMAS